MHIKQIIIFASVLALIIVACAVGVTLLNNNRDDVCTEHIDHNRDGLCDKCGHEMTVTPPEPEYEDKIEPIGKFVISAVSGEGYHITAPSHVIKGEDLCFTVEYSNYFNSTNATVTVNGMAVTPDTDGNYTVMAVTEDVEIRVSDLVRTHYGVTKVACLGARIEGEDKVAVNGSYSFTLALSDKATGTPTVTVNGTALLPTDNVYTVDTPNQNLFITVEGLVVPTVQMTYEQEKGYTVKGNPTIVGEEYLFSVHLHTDYESHGVLTVKANGVTLTETNGVYTLPNAPENVHIEVEGASLREKITISFGNCDLDPVTIYKATAWQEVIPTREGFIFNGWQDYFGSPVDFDYMSDTTLYASWLTEDGVDYLSELGGVVSKIKNRYNAVKDELWKLNPADSALVRQYEKLLDCHTDFELSFYSEHANVTAFMQKAECISDVVINKNAGYGANENAVQLFFTVDGNTKNKGASNMRLLSNGDEMDGVRYNIQEKDSLNSIILDYSLVFGKYNFERLCTLNGKVTFWISTNAVGLTAKVGEEDLFTAAVNTVVRAGESCALYRIDIQEQSVFVNGEYMFDLSEEEYNGTEPFSISVHRLDVISHQFAYVQISDIYAGAKDTSLVKVVKTSQDFAINNMLTVSYTDPENGVTTYGSSGVPSAFEGTMYNIQKPSFNAENLVLDYTFTVNPFNFGFLCNKYGSVSFKMMSNIAGTTVSYNGTELFETEVNKVFLITVQDGSIFVDGAYVCDLTESANSGTTAFVLNVHRLAGETYNQIHISNFTASQRNSELAKP